VDEHKVMGQIMASTFIILVWLYVVLLVYALRKYRAFGARQKMPKVPITILVVIVAVLFTFVMLELGFEVHTFSRLT
jgi:hypothetical protein